MKWILKNESIAEDINNIIEQLLEQIELMGDVSKRDIEINLDFVRKTRTTGQYSQNHHLNGHIMQICEETGNDFNTIKLYLKEQAISMGYPVKSKNGEMLLDPKGNPIPISERDCSTVECGYLIDCAHMLAAELGIILREPEWK